MEGNCPPQMATPYITKDRNGLAGPRFIRSTLNTIPAEKSVLAESKIPLGVLI